MRLTDGLKFQPSAAGYYHFRSKAYHPPWFDGFHAPEIQCIASAHFFGMAPSTSHPYAPA